MSNEVVLAHEDLATLKRLIGQMERLSRPGYIWVVEVERGDDLHAWVAAPDPPPDCDGRRPGFHTGQVAEIRKTLKAPVRDRGMGEWEREPR
jgi:hypothetical protein